VLFSRHCPHCRSVEFRGVGTRNVFEKAFHWMLLPFRCSLCGRHFMLMRWLARATGAL
jgi:hypothetical protein